MPSQDLSPTCLSEDCKQNKTAQIDLIGSSRIQGIFTAKRQFSDDQNFENTQLQIHENVQSVSCLTEQFWLYTVRGQWYTPYTVPFSLGCVLFVMISEKLRQQGGI